MDWTEIVSALAFLVVALAIGGGMLAASHILPWWLGHYHRRGSKLQPYECGVPRFETSQRHFSVKFYVMALMLALFDIESVFLILFAVNYRDFLGEGRAYSFLVLLEMLVFLGVLGFGLYYIIKRGVLDFNESTPGVTSLNTGLTSDADTLVLPAAVAAPAAPATLAAPSAPSAPSAKERPTHA